MSKPFLGNKKLHLLAGFLFFFVIFLKNAWVGDDAYIIFRSIEQLFSGNGPIWNPHERVQVFTSPLWFILLSLFRCISSDVFINAVILSAMLSLSMLILIVKILKSNLRFLFILLLLACSNGFFDFTSSGLENILGYFLITFFVYRYHSMFSDSCGSSINNWSSMNQLFFTYGLIILTRHDLSLLFFPALVYIFIQFRQRYTLRSWFLLILITFSPFIIWSFFSLIYYGSIFPNTAYAKLNTGIERPALLLQGIYYLVASLRYDSVTLVLIVIGMSVSLAFPKKYLSCLGFGIAVHLVYIVYIGGDFMQGRFLSYAYLLSLLILMIVYDAKGKINFNFQKKTIPALTMLIVLYLIFYPHTPFNSSLSYSNKNLYLDVADERGYYFTTCSIFQYGRYMLSDDKPAFFPLHERSRLGYEFAKTEPKATICYTPGFLAYWAGVGKIIFDPLALTDPFLSRLPLHREGWWRIGHFKRDIPHGYFDSVRTGKNSLENHNLRSFYEKIIIITQGKKLFSYERLKTILSMNLGLYDHYIDSYMKDEGLN